MRETMIVHLLAEQERPIKLVEIARNMNLSESSIRKYIRDINQSKNGFSICLIKGQGYRLVIENQEVFDTYIRSNPPSSDSYDPKQRLEMLLFYLLQETRFITINELIEKMQLSRSTISKNLKLVDEELKKFDLALEKKAHYGVIVTGSEHNYRRAFSKYVLHSKLYLKPTQAYKNFLETLPTRQLEDFLETTLAHYQLSINTIAFENVLTHLKILLFRTSQHNFISNKQFFTADILPVFIDVARDFNQWIVEQYGLSLPENEIEFLAVSLSSKTNATTITNKERQDLFMKIRAILAQLDIEFLTDFKNDEELIESLVLHMYPLLNRLYFNLQLENPLIEEIYVKYSNVFVVSYRFSERVEKEYEFTLTRDEIGYIALHFAAHFEREKNETLEKVKRIVVMCATGGGSAQLIRLKLESIFPNADVVTTSSKRIDEFENEMPNLFLTTIPMDDMYKGVPIIHIKQFLDDMELRRIKDITTLQFSEQKKLVPTLGIKQLFSEELFQIVDSGNYLEIIEKQGLMMNSLGYASDNYVELVLAREDRFSTIYQNGVAGPHPIELTAKKDSVGITLLKEPVFWQGRYVQIIFLINLKQGNLFLYKELSRLLLYLIDNSTVREKILKCVSFDQFLAELVKVI